MSEPPGTMEAPQHGSYANALKNQFDNLLEATPTNTTTSHAGLSPLSASMPNRKSVHFLFIAPFLSQQDIDKAISQHGPVLGSNKIRRPTNKNQEIHEVFFQSQQHYTSAIEDSVEFPRVGRVLGLTPRPYTVNTRHQELKINIREIPTGLSRGELAHKLHQTLSRYGKVKVSGRYLSPGAGVFHGEAMAILTRDSNNANTMYPDLQRTIQFVCDDEMTMHLSWHNCPPFCHFCKTEGHIRDSCPRLKRFLFCTNCRKNGHSATNCRTILHDNNHPNGEEVEQAFNELNEPNNNNNNNNNNNWGFLSLGHG